MCGICGIFYFKDSESEVKNSIITSMRDTMIHRGPDDADIYISGDKKVGLGHRRLSIIDLSKKGRQPMCNEDGTIWVVFNGEIYNYKELRLFLCKKGHKFISHTDTEVVIHSYEEFGEKCLDLFEGMFAFAIWDSKKNIMFLVRDRIGIKPLYYFFDQNKIIFASEIKAILAYPGIERLINEEALYHLLTFLTTPPPMTLFKGIKKLSPGCYMICKNNGKCNIVQYWDPIIKNEDKNRSQEFYIQKIRELLKESIYKRMRSDVPFGVFLSGGIDSSLNVALMSQLTDLPIETFNVAFKGFSNYDESNYARQIAKKFKTIHHEIIIDHEDLKKFLPKLIYHQDEPISDPVCVPLYYISDLLRKNNVIVVQVGEGSDEQFCGYNNYMNYIKTYKYWHIYNFLPRPVKKALYPLLRSLLQVASYYFSKRGYKKHIDYLIQSLYRAINDCELFWGGAISFWEPYKKKLLTQESRQKFRDYDSFHIIKENIDRIKKEKPEADFLERMIYLEFKIRLPELLLMRVDKITMSTSNEARVPFLDHRLVELSMQIPSYLKIKNGIPKYILKKAAEGLIPNNIIYRKKQGFDAPVKEWFMKELKDVMENILMNSTIRNKGYFDYKYIKKLIDQHEKKKFDFSSELWMLLNLSLWYDYWIEKVDIEKKYGLC